MTRRLPLLSVVALGATALLLAGCSGGTSAPTTSSGSDGVPETGGTVHMLQNADFSYLDPARGWDGGVNAFYRLVYRTLTTQASATADDPNAIVADLATDTGTVSDDGLTWTFTLKDGLAFDDGTPITSAEVKFGISRAWDPQIGIGSPYLKNVIDAPADYQGPYVSGEIPTIETPDDKTIIFHLKAPFPEFSAVLAQQNAVPFPLGSGAGDSFLQGAPASGPYSIDSYTPGTSIHLVRNTHWDAATDDVRKAYPDEWQFDIGLDASTIEERQIADQGDDKNALSGRISGAALPRLQEPQLKARVVSAPASCTTYLGMNTTKAPFDDVRVRQAINWGIDRAAIVNASGGTQLADVATTIIPDSVAGHTDFDLYPSDGNTGDVDEAKALLADAGLADGFTFVMDIRAQPAMQAQAEAVQEALKRIGVTVELNVIDTSIYYETIGTPAQQHDAAITGWCPDWATSASTFIPPLFDGRVITPKGNNNLTQLNDAAVNTRIDEVKAMTDQAAANTAWGELDKQIMELAPIAPLVQEKGLYLPGSNIAGYHPNTYMTDLTTIGLKDPAQG